MQRDRYEILGALRCGATSRVDKARDKVIGRIVAIKTLVYAFGAVPEQKRFLREAQIVGRLSHPSIVQLYDVDIEETGIARLVMEYVPGRTLQQVLAEEPIPWPRACTWAADLALALGRAHKAGIIHGDVKPANIMVASEGQVKLSDFGIARLATQVSGSGRLMGTPAYLSPEQILGGPHDTRSDLFSLGIILYQMLTGVPPFEGTSVEAVCAQILSTEPPPPSQRNPHLPKALDHIVMRCLSKSPADRYPSGEALASSLDPLTRHAPASEAPRVGPVNWISRRVGPRKAWALVAVVFLVGCLVPGVHVLGGLWHSSAMPISRLTVPQIHNHALDHPHPIPQQSVSKGAHAPTSGSRPALAETLPATLLPSAELPAPASSGSPHRALLHIRIETTSNQGMLAIFADHTLLLTAKLHSATGQDPVRLKQILPVGAHPLRVALYGADKTLQLEKDGLGEIRDDSANLLKIRVGRHSKHLMWRDTSLEVLWPGAIATQPSKEQSPGAPVLAAAAK